MASHSRKKIGVLDLSAAIKQVLTEYGEDVYKVLDEAVQDTVKQSTDKLKAVNSWANTVSGSPYSADWAHDDLQVDRVRVKRVVYNDGHARLTHLLEKGHVSKNGTGRTFGDVQAYPHIKGVNDWAVEELPKLIEDKLNRL